MTTSIIYIGMDVHTTNFTLCAYSILNQETFAQTQINPNVKELINYLKQLSDYLKKEIGINSNFVLGYEAGCFGYSLYHEISKYGYECKIVAPTTMIKSVDQKRKKNDHRDAEAIAKAIAYNTCSYVYIPSNKDDSVKEYMRMRNDIKQSLKMIKQRTIAFCTRHGKRYEGTYWTNKYIEWLKKLEFNELLLKDTLYEYLLEYDRLTEKIKYLDKKIEDISHEDEYNEKVRKLRCFKGIETHAALSFICEVGDFNRFPTANAFASFLGLTPSEYSSGNSINYGSITKAGNSHLRMLLVEASQAVSRGSAIKSKKLKLKQASNSEKVIAYADRANERLRKKYQKMILSSHKVNVTRIAIAREFACFIWGMMTEKID